MRPADLASLRSGSLRHEQNAAGADAVVSSDVYACAQPGSGMEYFIGNNHGNDNAGQSYEDVNGGNAFADGVLESHMQQQQQSRSHSSVEEGVFGANLMSLGGEAYGVGVGGVGATTVVPAMLMFKSLRDVQ